MQGTTVPFLCMYAQCMGEGAGHMPMLSKTALLLQTQAQTQASLIKGSATMSKALW